MSRPSQLRENWTATINDHVIDLAWSPDGKYIAAASVLGPVTIFEGGRRAVIHTFEGHEFGTMSIAWRPDSKVLASAGQDGKIRLWDITSGEATHSLDGGAAWVEHVAWSGGKKPILVSAAGRKLKLWNAIGDLVREYPDHQSTISGLQWKPRVRQLASITYGGVTLWDPQQSEAIRQLEWRGSSLVVEWSPNGKYIATGDQDSTVHFWIMSTGDDLQMSGYLTKVRELSWECNESILGYGRRSRSYGVGLFGAWTGRHYTHYACQASGFSQRCAFFNIAENCWPQVVSTVWSTSGNCEATSVLWRFMKPF